MIIFKHNGENNWGVSLSCMQKVKYISMLSLCCGDILGLSLDHSYMSSQLCLFLLLQVLVIAGLESQVAAL